jgi:phosphate starvation-inducible PhoH-like protein
MNSKVKFEQTGNKRLTRAERQELRDQKRQEKHQKRMNGEVKDSYNEDNTKPALELRNDFQKKLFNALNTKEVIVVLGPAGVGKTTITMWHATDRLYSSGKDKIEKIILTRPPIGMGKTIGLLPGDIDLKMAPYLAPCLDAYEERWGKGKVDTAIKNKRLEMLPLEYARGKNFKYVTICDEGQNTNPMEMYSLITRVNDGAQLIIMGDETQTDIHGENGLSWLRSFIKRHKLQHKVAIIETNSDDIVRGDLCKSFVKAMEEDRKNNPKK